VLFRLSRQFHFCITLLWFCVQSILMCSRGDKQYLDTTSWVTVGILGYNAVWFLLALVSSEPCLGKYQLYFASGKTDLKRY